MDVGIYVSRKNSNIKVEVTESYDKTKTLIYEGADGKSHSVSWSSFRKSYKKVEDDVKSEEKPVEEKKVEESNSEEKVQRTVKKDDTPKKEKKERKKRDMSEADAVFGDICGLAAKEFPVTKTYEKIPRFVLIRDENNKSMFEIRVNSKGIIINFRKDQAPVDIIKTQNNYYMPEVVKAENVKDVERIMKLYKKEAK